MTDGLAGLATRVEQAPYNAALGIRVESIAAGHVRMRVPYQDANSNPGRALHGGVAASAIGVAGGLAAATQLALPEPAERGTLDLAVTYLAAAIGEDIVAEAGVLRSGKEIVYCEVGVRNDTGKWIAKGLVTTRAIAAREPRPGRQLHTAADGTPSGNDVPEAARMLVAVPFIARLGMSIAHMRDGRAVVEMPFQDVNADHGEAVHEGAVAALIDTSGAMASWSIVGLDFRFKASTVAVHVNHHAPAVREDLVAHARTLRRNDEIFLNQVVVNGRRSGHVVATGSVTYRIVVPPE